MLHLGHFSFDELDYKHNTRHGYFTCVVYAADEENAVQKLKAHLVEMKQKNMAFSKIVKVYIEDIIQVETLAARFRDFQRPSRSVLAGRDKDLNL